MSAAPQPINEPQRLRELRSLEILDTDAEERFDRITRLARRLFDVPIALVTVVDEDRQWFKSAQGMDERETARDDSFCAYAILQNDVMLVTDATTDPRFADNRFVTADPGVRFYAGCPILGPGGTKVGTLCVIDHETRDFGTTEIESLRDLAAIVEREILSARLAIADDLTGLSNRRGFLVLGERLVSVCERHRVPLTIAYFDLDGFKGVNDLFGHDEGDRALRNFARLLEHEVRESDLVARLGGDEFVALLTNSVETTDVGDRVQHSLADSAYERAYELGVSYGCVTRYPGDDRTLSELLRLADTAMYQCKYRAASMVRAR
jgi:diguanylate cyclase (GGDEF)-like protein